jgi:DNA adenine methylase
MSFYRYPGGKGKLKDQIITAITNHADGQDLEYREPFFGGGSVGLNVLDDNCCFNKFWINDYDIGIACLWSAVIQYPQQLKNKIKGFNPEVKYFDQFKDEMLNLTRNYAYEPDELINIGFKKLALHQISYSGLGTKSGGPLGGREQKSQYKINCRWSPDYICKKIDKVHNKFKSVAVRNSNCSCLDFEDIIAENTNNALLYLDPPYYIKGNDLYQHGLSNHDHLRLMGALKTTKHKWVLSYDDCEEIRELYKWANITEIQNVNYSITATRDKETGQTKTRYKNELLIFSV